MDLHCAYHQGSRHKTDHFSALRHAIQDLIDQGLLHLGQPSVTINLLPAHTAHVVPPPTDGIHFINFVEPDDRILMLIWNKYELEPIVVYEIYEVDRVTLGP